MGTLEVCKEVLLLGNGIAASQLQIDKICHHHVLQGKIDSWIVLCTLKSVL